MTPRGTINTQKGIQAIQRVFHRYKAIQNREMIIMGLAIVAHGVVNL